MHIWWEPVFLSIVIIFKCNIVRFMYDWISTAHIWWEPTFCSIFQRFLKWIFNVSIVIVWHNCIFITVLNHAGSFMYGFVISLLQFLHFHCNFDNWELLMLLMHYWCSLTQNLNCLFGLYLRETILWWLAQVLRFCSGYFLIVHKCITIKLYISLLYTLRCYFYMEIVFKSSFYICFVTWIKLEFML